MLTSSCHAASQLTHPCQSIEPSSMLILAIFVCPLRFPTRLDITVSVIIDSVVASTHKLVSRIEKIYALVDEYTVAK
jgi:hypothetical protein